MTAKKSPLTSCSISKEPYCTSIPPLDSPDSTLDAKSDCYSNALLNLPDDFDTALIRQHKQVEIGNMDDKAVNVGSSFEVSDRLTVFARKHHLPQRKLLGSRLCNNIKPFLALDHLHSLWDSVCKLALHLHHKVHAPVAQVVHVDDARRVRKHQPLTVISHLNIDDLINAQVHDFTVDGHISRINELHFACIRCNQHFLALRKQAHCRQWACHWWLHGESLANPFGTVVESSDDESPLVLLLKSEQGFLADSTLEPL